MFWIHGGGLTMGNSSYYRPKTQLLHRGVVVVTIQYRLGIMGEAVTAAGRQVTWTFE